MADSKEYRQIKKVCTGQASHQKWRFDVEALLDGFDLLEELQKFESGAPLSSGFDLKSRACKQLRTVVIASLDGDAHDTVMSSAEGGTLFGAMRALSKAYGGQSKGSRMVSLTNLMGEPQAAGETVEKYVNRKVGLFRERLKKVIDPEEVLCASIVVNCHKELRPLVMPLITREKISLEEITSTLLEGETVAKLHKGESSEAVLLAKATVERLERQVKALQVKAKKGAGKGREGATCSHCGGSHQVQDCWDKFPDTAPNWVKAKRRRTETAHVAQFDDSMHEPVAEGRVVGISPEDELSTSVEF